MKSIVDGEISKNGVTAPDGDSSEQVCNATNIMDDTISSALEKGGAPVEVRQKYGGFMWSISTKCISKVVKDVVSKRLPTTP